MYLLVNYCANFRRGTSAGEKVISVTHEGTPKGLFQQLHHLRRQLLSVTSKTHPIRQHYRNSSRARYGGNGFQTWRQWTPPDQALPRTPKLRKTPTECKRDNSVMRWSFWQRNFRFHLMEDEIFLYRGADKSLARPDRKNNWKVAIFRPTRRSLLPRRPGWTDNLLNFFFEWLAKVRVWSL